MTIFFFFPVTAGPVFQFFEEKWSTVKKKKQKTRERGGRRELPKKGAGLAVGRFTLLFGGHFLLDSHLHLALQGHLQLRKQEIKY